LEAYGLAGRMFEAMGVNPGRERAEEALTALVGREPPGHNSIASNGSAR
jgi:hypothetical protein